MSRRIFFQGAVNLCARPLPGATRGAAYAFTIPGYHVRVKVDFYDRYSSSGFSFGDLSLGRDFCLSMTGEENRKCPAAFVGSLAIARYSFRRRSGTDLIAALREHVRTIDHDTRVPYRLPIDRRIELRDGVASDVQAFGYDAAAASLPSARGSGPDFPWCYFRQDLYTDAKSAPFLVVHWRHTPDSIRILDVIPGEGTWPIKQTR